MRKTDIVARFGGEEFCVLAVNMGSAEAAKVFEDMRRIIEDTPVFFNNKENSLHVTVSIGVCVKRAENIEQMVKVADDLLYDGKNSGRNCVRMSRDR